MKGRKVLLAFDSKTMNSLLEACLKEANFEIITSSDGIDALKTIYREMPDCVIVSTDLPSIDGYKISHLVKSSGLSSVAVIIAGNQAEDESRFKAENSLCDSFIIPSSDNLHIVCSLVEKNIGKYSSEKKHAVMSLTDKEMIELIVDRFDEELFEYYIIKSAYVLENSYYDTEQFLNHLSKIVSCIYNYDALGIIINEKKLIEYYDYADSIYDADIADFKKICHNDFSSRIPTRKTYNWNESQKIETIIEVFSDEKEKIKNYDLFPTDPNLKYPMTIHVGVTTLGVINKTTRKKLDFIVSVYSQIIEKHILFNKAVENEKKLRKAFSRFLPAKVIDSITSDVDTTVSCIGEQRNVAVLMADIRNFTALCEINTPEHVVAFLNGYFSCIGEIIKKHGGTIDKFVGAEVIALFGVPESYRYNAFRASYAALDIVDSIKTIDTSFLVFPEDFVLKVGIGIHYGKPIVGTIGSEDRKEYTVIGDDVNLASRVENLTKLYDIEILITDAVKKDLEKGMAETDSIDYLKEKRKVILRYLDKVKVKEKSVPIDLFELTSDEERFSENFLCNFDKGLYQYLMGNFSGAQDYFRIAKILCPRDQAVKVLLERCREFAKKPPKNWDGAIALASRE